MEKNGESRSFAEIMANPSELIQIVQEGRLAFLSALNPVELSRLTSWYRENFEKLDEKDRVTFLEEFCLHRSMGDQDVLFFIQALNQEGRARLGHFLGKVVESGPYVQSFYECWASLDEFRKKDFIYQFTVLEPEHAFMVAPFVNLSRIWVGEKGVQPPKYRKKPRRWKKIVRPLYPQSKDENRSLMKVYFNSTEELSPLIENLVEFVERGRRAQEKLDPGTFEEEVKNVEYALGKCSASIAIYLFLDRLLDLGLISGEEYDTYFEGTKLGLWLPTLTKGERERQAVQVRKVQRYLKQEEDSQGKGDYHFGYGFNQTDLRPKKAIRENERLRDEGVARDVAHLLYGFVIPHRDRLEYTSFLGIMLEEGLPIFLEVENLGLSKEEVLNFIEGLDWIFDAFDMSDLSDLRQLLRFNRAHPEGPDLEAYIVDKLCINLSQDVFTYHYLLIHADEVLDEFSPTHRKKILEAVSEKMPSLWLFNLRYAVEQAGVDLGRLLSNGRVSGRELILHYFDLKRAIQKYATEQDRMRWVEVLDSKFNQSLEKDPDLLFDERLQFSVNNFLGVAKRNDFIKKQLESGEGGRSTGFLIKVMEDGVLRDKFFNEIRGILRAKDDVFVDFIGREFGAKSLFELFSEQEIAKRLAVVVRGWDIKTPGNYQVRLLGLLIQYPDLHLDIRLKIMSLILPSIKGKKPKEIEAALGVNHAGVGVWEHELRGDLSRQCDLEPGYVFKKGVISILEDRAKPYVERDIEAYAAIYPEALIQFGFIEKYISPSVWRLILHRHNRSIAFLGSADEGRWYQDTFRVSNSVRFVGEATNPFSLLEDKANLSRDYYQSVIERLQEEPFYSFYGKKLEKIAREEMRKKGPTLHTAGRDDLRTDFTQLADRVALLSLSPVATRNKELLNALPDETREEFFQILELISLYGLDHELDFELDLEKTPEALVELKKVVLEFLLKRFEIKRVGEVHSELLSSESIRAFMLYDAVVKASSEEMKDAFKICMTKIFEGTFYAWRTWGEGEDGKEAGACLDQMKEKNLLPKSLSLEAYRQWVEDDSFELMEVFEYDIRGVQIGVSEVIDAAIEHQHIDSDLITLTPSKLKERRESTLGHLDGLIERKKQLFESYKTPKEKKKRRLGKNKIYKRFSPEDKEIHDQLSQDISQAILERKTTSSQAEALAYLHRLGSVSLKEVMGQYIDVGGSHVPLHRAFRVMRDAFSVSYPDFALDITRLETVLKKARGDLSDGKVLTRLSLTDKVDIQTHVMIGERPVASCQHYNGGSYAVGLLSYLVDPGVKIIQMRNEKGGLIARSILRLLEDDKGGAQLFVEEVYSVDTHPKIKEGILAFASRKAEKMGLDLYTGSMGEVSLHSKGSRSAYVYTDAGGGKRSNGIYTIFDAEKYTRPEKRAKDIAA